MSVNKEDSHNCFRYQRHFVALNVNSKSIYIVQGVGKKVRIRELMGIASADENDDHVISVRKYKNLQDAIKKAVYIKIGTSNSMSSIVFHFASKFPFWKDGQFLITIKNCDRRFLRNIIRFKKLKS